ncbi:hypothetical protein NQ317_008359 [Molorchus minor]|uniref:Major facilitator superfamily (MFS) profile domain-containing protein n=1 Tax=Molorchus minor TaxID=1323400 RepID=A0ABQ9K651_9CUCU|nr:hypothetical protein NQ317_008359 [Molorchus minor]
MYKHTVLLKIGYGRFHYELMAACALSIIAVGLQNALSSYIFPAAQCELKLTSFELGLLNISFLAGGIASCFLWGNAADMNGRRKILIATHFSNVVATVVCSLNPYKISLIACRLANGFLIGAPGSIIFSYVAEFQPSKYQQASICYCGLFFTLSWLILPVTASFVLPLEIDYELGGFLILTPWRLFMIFLTVPDLLAAFWFVRMPESPKFYAAKGETNKALVVLRRMYASNTGCARESFPVKRLINPETVEMHAPEGVSCASRTLRVLRKMVGQSRDLFRPPLVCVTLLTCGIMFANMFGVFGLGLWFPEIFIRFEHFHKLHPNGTASLKELSAFNYVKNATCEPSLDSSVIHNTVAMALSAILYNLIAGVLSTKIHVKTISTVSMLIGGLCAASIYFLKTPVQNLVVACIFQATMITANTTVGAIGVELFPTQIAVMALCVIICAGRIGAVASNFIFGYFIGSSCEVPIFVVAGVVLAGAVLCSVVPREKKICGGEW